MDAVQDLTASGSSCFSAAAEAADSAAAAASAAKADFTGGGKIPARFFYHARRAVRGLISFLFRLRLSICSLFFGLLHILTAHLTACLSPLTVLINLVNAVTIYN